MSGENVLVINNSRAMNSEEDTDIDLQRINIDEHQDVSQKDLLGHNLPFDIPYSPQGCESSMNCIPKLPLVGKNTSVDPSFDPTLDNIVQACKLNYNDLSNDTQEAPLFSIGHQKAITDESEDNSQNSQFNIGVGVAHDSVDSSSPILEIRQSSFFHAVLNGVNILAGSPYTFM